MDSCNWLHILIGEPMPSYIVHYTRARRTQRDELLAVEGANEELANFLFEANSCAVQTSAVGLAIRAAKNRGKLHYKGTPIPADAEVHDRFNRPVRLNRGDVIESLYNGGDA